MKTTILLLLALAISILAEDIVILPDTTTELKTKHSINLMMKRSYRRVHVAINLPMDVINKMKTTAKDLLKDTNYYDQYKTVNNLGTDLRINSTISMTVEPTIKASKNMIPTLMHLKLTSLTNVSIVAKSERVTIQEIPEDGITLSPSDKFQYFKVTFVPGVEYELEFSTSKGKIEIRPPSSYLDETRFIGLHSKYVFNHLQSGYVNRVMYFAVRNSPLCKKQECEGTIRIKYNVQLDSWFFALLFFKLFTLFVFCCLCPCLGLIGCVVCCGFAVGVPYKAISESEKRSEENESLIRDHDDHESDQELEEEFKVNNNIDSHPIKI
ncbi:hypothetical protein AKO1_011639 [Acrasis kona]|uniref:Uncharacterized protein n=1 Tax=Acrasis kona TaxID=1008807 RepID=A0AAW2Z734_9EUKA